MAVQLASGALKSRVDGTSQWQDAIIAVRLSDVAVQPTAPTGMERIWFDTDDTEETVIPDMNDHLTLAKTMAVVVDGKRANTAAAENDYVILQNSEIAGKDDGLYLANKAIPVDTDLDGTYLKTDNGLAKGGLNGLKDSIKLTYVPLKVWTTIDSGTVTLLHDIVPNNGFIRIRWGVNGRFTQWIATPGSFAEDELSFMSVNSNNQVGVAFTSKNTIKILQADVSLRDIGQFLIPIDYP